ncbi:hypothetical protein PIB30_030096 [Stylosanthes scabra]|uniref:GH10 domain-containing protein n=1 Tax=Stylosanthes scabra TaxID=79078 RepID=A0ABU6XCY0_9FABA|nr:hypothetical protein [Stylosanthes scabra]
MNLSFTTFNQHVNSSIVEDGPMYDSTAYTECKEEPEKPLYNGGVFESQPQSDGGVQHAIAFYVVDGPSFILHNLTQDTIYSFSSSVMLFLLHTLSYHRIHNKKIINGEHKKVFRCRDLNPGLSAWVRIEGSSSGLIRASLQTENETYDCIGTVLAKRGCWSFLKGGFLLNWPSTSSMLLFQNTDGKDINIELASPSLQPFTKQQWRFNQEYLINTHRKQAVTVHVSDSNGKRMQGATITIEQISKDFPFGSAIAKTILGNMAYQNWFVKRFNAAVFENELKWYATEPDQGKAAVDSRIQSLMNQYREEFIHWDVSNEMLHFDFYEKRLGPNATFHFFETAHKSDPLATLFMNDFNVVETCSDVNSTVDTYISRLRELQQNGVFMDGIGLESHFTVPNLPLMRAIIDKLATLNLPIWLTEVDISKTLGKQTQAIYLEQVLREGFSHPSVNGIMLWTALHPQGCYQMCLTDNDFRNLPSGDVVDKLLQEWQTAHAEGVTDEHGSYSIFGFLGEYRVTATYGNKTADTNFSLCGGRETKHVTIRL